MRKEEAGAGTEGYRRVAERRTGEATGGAETGGGGGEGSPCE